MTPLEDACAAQQTMLAVYEARDRAVREALGAKPEETTDEAARRARLSDYQAGHMAGLREALALIVEHPLHGAAALVAERIDDVLAQATRRVTPVPAARRCNACGRTSSDPAAQHCDMWQPDDTFCTGMF